MPLSPLSSNRPIVDADFLPSQVMRLFSEQVSQLAMLSGVGSPEGVVSASVDRLYRDSAGTASNILYVKNLAAIGGNSKFGWVKV